MENKTTTSGVGFCGLLTIAFVVLAFVVLKLVGIIKWSWLWVLSPVWIPSIVCLIYSIVCIWIIRG